eukprot:6774506-Pyramimonas_sp.AAC.1
MRWPRWKRAEAEAELAAQSHSAQVVMIHSRWRHPRAEFSDLELIQEGDVRWLVVSWGHQEGHRRVLAGEACY